ncbi:hypothetical protein EKO04_004236 [Ascochyta lentis]|uniref:Uncharacterized protein n=1 Tax=Ascochyta lentis TaxID=205686 RepID=A0A8H7J977_9PLEO|nr:hypothetical protein EKO04_004236 [Ascochyta lentis]
MPSSSAAAHSRAQSSSSLAHSDAEAASQQLLAESSPLRRQRAAIRANQLNLARVDALPKPPAMAPSTYAGNPGKLGKLKRISFSGETQRKARGVKVYDIEPSPQKRRSLPVQAAAFIEEDQEDRSVASQAEDMVPETSQAEPEADQSVENVEGEDLSGQNNGTAGERIDEQLAVSSVISLQEDASSATHDSSTRPSKRKNADSATSARPSDSGTAEVQDADVHVSGVSTTQDGKAPVGKKRRLLKGPKFLDPDTDALVDYSSVPIATTQYETRPRGDPQPEVQMPIISNRRRVSLEEADKAAIAAVNAVVAKTSKSREPSRRLRTKIKAKPNASKMKTPSDNKTLEPEEADKDNRETDPQTTAAQPKSIVEPNGEGEDADQDIEVSENDKEHVNEDREPDAEVADLPALPSTNMQPTQLLALAKVFQYTDSEERPGRCLTRFGRKIYHTCDRSRVTLSQSGKGPTLEDVAKCIDDVVNLLRMIDTRIEENRRSSFKTDAFAHLFRVLTLVLKAMYDKLQETEGDITRSLNAMQILYPYVGEILRFKDAIDGWKVTLPLREPGDRLIKDVESLLIVPLRAVEKKFRFWLGRLESAEQILQAHLDLQRKQKEQEQELLRQEEKLSVRKDRRKRWQDLHIVRMQCEPDAARRRRLRFVEPIELVETDANGEQFERIPCFGERSMPRPQWAAAPSSREWTDEQETVLLDALQSSAALEDIFKAHCRPGGALRAFSVSDITVKMAWVRSGWSRLSQQHGWEIPEWAKNIPVLP